MANLKFNLCSAKHTLSHSQKNVISRNDMAFLKTTASEKKIRNYAAAETVKRIIVNLKGRCTCINRTCNLPKQIDNMGGNSGGGFHNYNMNVNATQPYSNLWFKFQKRALLHCSFLQQISFPLHRYLHPIRRVVQVQGSPLDDSGAVVPEILQSTHSHPC